MEALPESEGSSSNPTNQDEKAEPTKVTTQTTPSSLVGQGRPSKSQFALWRKPDPRWKSLLLRDTLTPFRSFFYPIILWTGLVAGGNINICLFYILTESQILSAPPYNFSVAAVGYSNFAFLAGGLVGLFTGGPLSDFITRRSARRNYGIREAEMRLPALIPFGCLTAVSLIVGAVGYQRQWAWPILLVIGYAGAGMAATTIPTIVTAYAIDSYKPLTGEIMIVVTVVKNTCGFSMSYWVPSLSTKFGPLTPAMVQFALGMGPLALTPVLFYFGKKLRVMTRNSYVHKMSED